MATGCGGSARRTAQRLWIYPLSLAIYCTSWTFFGSVGLATRNGFDFLAIYIGPVLMIGLASPLIIRITRLSKAQNIVSIADFIGARYGKQQGVAATVAVIAIFGTIPYIALAAQSRSRPRSPPSSVPVVTFAGPVQPMLGDPPLFVALSLAAFAVLFGTRHIDATEHQHGLMLAIAVESVVKLVAFVAVGVFVTFVMFGGPLALFETAMERPDTAAVLTSRTDFAMFAAMTLLSLFAVILLPRQFYVTVVENKTDAEIRRAAWLFPLYLVLINLFVVPVALAGMLTFAPGTVDSDMYVLALPIAAGSEIPRPCRLHRRPVGGGRHGDRRDGRARHHGVERHRGAARAQAPRRHQCRHPSPDRAPHRHLRGAAVRLSLLPLRPARPSSPPSG